MSNIYVQEPQTFGKVLLDTSVGDIDVELWSKEAPLACRNFVQLCLEHYYDGTIFHRVIKNFIAQGGDPTGTGLGGESIYDQPFKDEFHSRIRFCRRGLVAMANAGKNDNGSQFFFTLAATPSLQNKHTIFGSVGGSTIYNMLKLGDALVDKDDRPVYPPTIISTKVLLNPFDDIIPRQIKFKSSGSKDDLKKKEIVGVKNFKLLSFGEEAEEDEVDLAEVNKKFSGKTKSVPGLVEQKDTNSKSDSSSRKTSHEYTSGDEGFDQTKKMKKDSESGDDSDDSEVNENTSNNEADGNISSNSFKKNDDSLLESIRKKLSSKTPKTSNKMQSEFSSAKERKRKSHGPEKEEKADVEVQFNEKSSPSYDGSRMRSSGSSKIIKRSSSSSKEKSYSTSEEKNEKTAQVGDKHHYDSSQKEKRYEEENTHRSKDLSSSSEYTIDKSNYAHLRKGKGNIDSFQMLKEFQQKIRKLKRGGKPVADEKWITHELNSGNSTAVLAKDANTMSSDWYDITDPRNSINKRRREKD